MGLRNRLPALGPAVEAAGTTARRFPLVIAAAVVSAMAGILAMEDLGPAALQGRLLASASLGLPLFLAATLAGEDEDSFGRRAMWHIGVFIVLAGVHVAWPRLTEQQQFLRYAQLSSASHLLVSFLPVPNRRQNAFWQYNRIVFERFVISVVTTGATFVGLALALAAVDKLFGVAVAPQGYARLWITLAFILNTWFFLGGLPRDIEPLEERGDYPAGIRIFAQYTLLPLVSLYLVILTLYLGKVLVTWDWPSGWIGWLVSGVATAGIFTLLLVHPVARQPEQKWVAVFARDFWIAILPAVGMLWLAIWQRTSQYGMTEPRYFLLLMSIWLFTLALYYGITRSQNIRIIPASLCLLALITFAGPLSAYSAAERSQFGRLRGILERNGIVENGQLRAGPFPALSTTDHREIEATIRFLSQRNATDRLAAWIGDSAASAINVRGEAQVQRYLVALGLPERHMETARPFRLTAEPGAAIPAAGYDLLLRIQPRGDTTGRTGLYATLSADGRAIDIKRGDSLLLALPLDSMLERAGAGRDRFAMMSDTLMRVSAQNRRARATAHLEWINGMMRNRVTEVDGIAGDVLLDVKP